MPQSTIQSLPETEKNSIYTLFYFFQQRQNEWAFQPAVFIRVTSWSNYIIDVLSSPQYNQQFLAADFFRLWHLVPQHLCSHQRAQVTMWSVHYHAQQQVLADLNAYWVNNMHLAKAAERNMTAFKLMQAYNQNVNMSPGIVCLENFWWLLAGFRADEPVAD